MKLNRAYTQSLKESLDIILNVLTSTEFLGEFTSAEFNEAIHKKKIKYCNSWFPILRRLGIFASSENNSKKYYYSLDIEARYSEIEDEFAKVLITMKCNPYIEYGRNSFKKGLTREFNDRSKHTCNVIDKANFNKEQPKSNTTLDEEAAIKLLSSLGYSVFKFSWIHTTMVDKNAVKVTGYYKLNKA